MNNNNVNNARPLIKTALLAVALAAGLSACATAMSPVNGSIWADVKGPLGATTESTPSKTGKSCASSILGIIATGDASIEAAKKMGKISKVSSVDYASTNMLGFYSKFCTIVSGN
jgi:hypothetical protein